MKTPAVIYTRISSNRSAGAGVGIARQELLCRELVEHRGYQIEQVFPEDDTSAYSGKPRPQYKQLLEVMRSGTIRVVLAYHTDRIHRSPVELEEFITICEAHNVRVETVLAGPIDLSTPTGRMGARVYGAVAKYETEHNVERLTAQKREAAKAGKWSGGGRPYGYEKDGITIRDCEAPVIRDSVAKLIAGESRISVVRWLNDSGRFTSSGQKWQLGNFLQMLKKKRYVIGGKCPAWCAEDCDIPHGIRLHEPENGGPKSEHPAEWPGIIPMADYELMMARLKESSQTWDHGLIKGRSYLLSGLAFCGSCGSAMYGQRRNPGTGVYQRRYRCKAYNNCGERVGCGRVFRDAPALDEFITEAVLTRLDSPTVVAALANSADQAEVQTLAEELMRLKVRRKDIARKLALARGDEEADINVMLETVRDAIEQTQTALGKFQSKKSAAILPRSGRLFQAWEEANIAWRRDVISLIAGKIIVNPAGKTRPKWNGHIFDINLIEVEWVA